MSDLMMSSDERQARVESLLGRGDRRLSAEERAAVRAEIVGFLAEECGVEAAAITADTDLADAEVVGEIGRASCRERV